MDSLVILCPWLNPEMTKIMIGGCFDNIDFKLLFKRKISSHFDEQAVPPHQFDAVDSRHQDSLMQRVHHIS